MLFLFWLFLEKQLVYKIFEGFYLSRPWLNYKKFDTNAWLLKNRVEIFWDKICKIPLVFIFRFKLLLSAEPRLTPPPPKKSKKNKIK